jgi:phospholipid N-methyltransferase
MLTHQSRRFFTQFLVKPGAVGAVAASSPALARRMVEWIDWSQARAVVEYGPGTGAFTGEILARLGPSTKFFAVEINPSFVAILAERFPGLAVHQESVRDVRDVCAREGVEQIDAVLCGLPWAAFRRDDQTAYLDAMMSVLRPGGQFATFAYLQGLLLPAARRFRRMLGDYFSSVETSPVVWRNFPPALVYRCRR